MDFGENIRELRQQKGLTQQNLADQLYVSRQCISRWENGSRYPDLCTAKVLAGFFGTTLDELLSDQEAVQSARKQNIGRQRMLMISILLSGAAGILILMNLVYIIIGLLHGDGSDLSFWVIGPEIILRAAMFTVLIMIIFKNLKGKWDKNMITAFGMLWWASVLVEVLMPLQSQIIHPFQIVLISVKALLIVCTGILTLLFYKKENRTVGLMLTGILIVTAVYQIFIVIHILSIVWNSGIFQTVYLSSLINAASTLLSLAVQGFFLFAFLKYRNWIGKLNQNQQEPGIIGQGNYK